jgi:methylase of polypeptide subunit release factors
MKNILSDIFQRTLASLAGETHACLRLDHISPVEDQQSLKAPTGTALILGLDDTKLEPVTLFCITAPTLSPDHSGLLAMIVRRAQAQKAPYFITWTLRDAVLWKTPKPGTPAQRSHLEKIRDYEDNYAIAQDGGNQVFDEPLRLRTIALGQKMLNDVECLFKNQALELVRIDATYFVQSLLDSVHALLPMVTDSLHMRFATDLDLRAKFNVWALTQGIAGDHKDRDYALSIARHIIYRLLGKILFYQGLRRAARQLPALNLDNIDPAQVLPTLRRAFAEALKVDYHAVFSEDLPDTVSWPGEAAKRLAALIHDFNTRDFSSLPQDVVGTVFERLIPPEDRHLLGQYFTNEPLCDLGIVFCVLSPSATVADLTCGTGTFLIRSYDRKRWLGNHDHATLLSQLWGIDIAPFPAELAVINLFRQNLTAAGNFPRIACRDLFTIKPGDTIPFPPPKMDLEHPKQIQEPIPLFDAIVGNLPYVSADQIGQKDTGYLDFIRRTLIEGWLEKYPALFCYANKTEQKSFERQIAAGQHKSVDRDRLQLRTSTYADLYVYLFLHAARFLKPGGRMGIITSNAWLDVNYGYALQRFFCDQFKIVAILESRCEPWFTEASVNTVFTIIERCEDQKERDRHLVKFVKVRKRLADLMPGDTQVEARERWKRLMHLVDKVEAAGRKDAKTVPLGVVTEEDDDFRIRVCRQGELRADLERDQKTVKWGKYLRAPQVFLELADRKALCMLSQIAQVRRGSLSGINEFYHLTPERAKERGIEPEFLKPLLKSPGESGFIPIDKKQLALRLFVCRLPKGELKKQGKTGALKYIEWGEKQVFQSGAQRGLTWPNGAEVKVRTPGWYAIPEHRSKPAQVFFASAFGERHMHRFCSTPVIADKRLYFLTSEKGIDNTLLAALMNSSVTTLSTEVVGRLSMGDGVLELTVEEANDYLLVPDLREITAAQKKDITTVFESLCQREIGNIFDEVKKKDRQALDSAILSAIGLDSKKYLKPIYDALCELVRERIELGQQRGKSRKTKARKSKAENESFKEVLDEHLPSGPKRFPDELFSIEASKGKMIEVPLPETPLRLDIVLTHAVLYDGNKSFHEVRFPAEGKFILYCQKAGQAVARVPAKTVEVTRTVANYENYLCDLRKTLYDAYYRRTLDVAVAERLTQAAFDRFKLPKLSSE